MNLKQFEDQVVTLDAGCAERSCACYNPQFGDIGGVRYYPENVVQQLQAEIGALKDEAAWWEMSYENCHRTCSGYGMN